MEAVQNKPEKELIEKGLSLPVMESFYTVQGEGYNTGKAAYFIRLAGCDVGCHWCDVKSSWDAAEHPLVPVTKIVEQTIEHSAKAVVITGGEPLMYNLENLTQQLTNAGKEVWLETSGAYEITGVWHWVCFSPKKFALPKPSIYKVANELKVVVFNLSDLQWAEEHAAKVNKDCKLYLQPEWERRELMMPIIVEYIKENPQWNISLQTHKYLDIP